MTTNAVQLVYLVERWIILGGNYIEIYVWIIWPNKVLKKRMNRALSWRVVEPAWCMWVRDN